jgi:hypothetical protein
LNKGGLFEIGEKRRGNDGLEVEMGITRTRKWGWTVGEGVDGIVENMHEGECGYGKKIIRRILSLECWDGGGAPDLDSNIIKTSPTIHPPLHFQYRMLSGNVSV